MWWDQFPHSFHPLIHFFSVRISKSKLLVKIVMRPVSPLVSSSYSSFLSKMATFGQNCDEIRSHLFCPLRLFGTSSPLISSFTCSSYDRSHFWWFDRQYLLWGSYCLFSLDETSSPTRFILLFSHIRVFPLFWWSDRQFHFCWHQEGETRYNLFKYCYHILHFLAIIRSLRSMISIWTLKASIPFEWSSMAMPLAPKGDCFIIFYTFLAITGSLQSTNIYPNTESISSV